jgi:hypothetical protein
MSFFRVTGVVKRCETRNGVSKAGSDYSITNARVLVADLDFVEVTLGKGQAEPLPGTPIDWLVRVSASGGFLRISFVEEWRAALPAPAPSANGKAHANV